jgi:hypothetical protein
MNNQILRFVLSLTLVALFLVGCGASAPPDDNTTDVVVTQAATPAFTARAPTSTPAPTNTLTPTPTAVAAVTPSSVLPTVTAIFTPSLVPPTATPIPTLTPASESVEEALRRAETWASIVIVLDLFGQGVTELPDVKSLNEGAVALLDLDIDLSTGAFREVLETAPSAKDYNWLGTVFLLNAEESNLFVGVESVPAAALSNLGIALKIKGNLDESEMALREAIELKADFFPAHNNLGWVLRSKMEWDGATASFHEALRLEPDFADAQGNLGITLFLKGEREQAMAELEKAKELFEMAERDSDVVVIDELLSELK